VKLRRGRFDDLVRRQLDLFEADEAELLEEIAEAEQAWSHAGGDAAEEAYGDYQLAVDAAADILLDIRESYAATLTEPHDEEYRNAFTRAASRRFRRLSTLLADLDE
jgi:hypothetical protein